MSESTPSSRQGPPRLPYMPGVDGLRALAVAAVFVYHLGASWLPGGFLGVDVFFVISGYLITSLLLAEHRRSGRIELAPLLAAPGAAAAAGAVPDDRGRRWPRWCSSHPGEVAPAARRRARLARLRRQLVLRLRATCPTSSSSAGPSLFQHLWSLAVEEQFYLLWPPVIAAGPGAASGGGGCWPGWSPDRRRRPALAWVLWEPVRRPLAHLLRHRHPRGRACSPGSPWRSCWPATRLRRGRAAAGAAPCSTSLGVAAPGAAARRSMLTLGDLDERALPRRLPAGGARRPRVLIAVRRPPRVAARPAFGGRRSCGSGLRSYGIYLWHWPVIMLTRADRTSRSTAPALVALQLALTVGAAALSYRYVEQPFRRHGIAGSASPCARWSRRTARPARFAAASTAAAAVAALAVAVAVLLPGDDARHPRPHGRRVGRPRRARHRHARGPGGRRPAGRAAGVGREAGREGPGRRRLGDARRVGRAAQGAAARLGDRRRRGPAVPRGRASRHQAPRLDEAARGRHPHGQQRLRAVRRPRGADEAPARHAPGGAGDGAGAAQVAGLGERRAGVRRRPPHERRDRRLARGVGSAPGCWWTASTRRRGGQALRAHHRQGRGRPAADDRRRARPAPRAARG